MAVQNYYFAFISYSRKDEEHAKWLHSQFEHYKLPAHVRNIREGLPDSFIPIFRDEDELSSGYLSLEISQALINSKWLIILCSPNSATIDSYVSKEIESFISSHIHRGETIEQRIKHIIPIIIDGKPYAEDKNKECFPKSLRELRDRGYELRAPNVNSAKDGWERSFIAAISTMLELPFDTLWNRRQKEIEENHRKLIEINNKITLNHSRAVSSRAKELILNGDNITASLLMSEIIGNKHHSIIPNPYCPEAESALRMSLNNDSYRLEFNAGEVRKAIWNNEGSLIAALFDDNCIRIWDSKNGSNVQLIDGLTTLEPFNKITDFIWLNKENLLYATNGGKIMIYNLATKYIRQIFAIDFSVDKLLFLINYNHIVFLSRNALFIITLDGVLVLKVEGAGKGFIIDFTITQKQNLIYYIHEKQICCYNPKDKNNIILTEITEDDCLKLSSISSLTNEQIAMSTRSGEISIFDTNPFALIKTLTGHEAAVWSISFDSSGKFLSSGDSKGCCAIWDVHSGNAINVLYLHKKHVKSCSLDKQGFKLLTCSNDGSIRITDLQLKNMISSVSQPYHYNDNECDFSNNTALRHIYGSNRITSAISVKDGTLITTSQKGDFSLWNIESDTPMSQYRFHNSEIKSLCMSYDEKILFSIGCDYKLNICKLNHHEISQLYTLNGCYTNIAAHPLTTHIIAVIHVEKSEYIQLIDYSTANILSSIKFKEGTINSIVINHSGELLAIGTESGDTYIMQINTWKVIATLSEHRKSITSLSFSPQKNILVSGSEDRTIKVWDINNEQTSLRTLEGHDSSIEFLTFDEDGKFLISCGNDGNIATWEISRGIILNSFHQPYFFKGLYAKYIKNKHQIIYIAGELVFLLKYPSLEEELHIAKQRNNGRTLTCKDREKYLFE